MGIFRQLKWVSEYPLTEGAIMEKEHENLGFPTVNQLLAVCIAVFVGWMFVCFMHLL